MPKNYTDFRKSIEKRIEERPELSTLSTFVPNKRLPVYNWFYYKEGFSKELVELLLREFEIGQGGIVLDPFCGSGTTLLCCKERGINAIGYDVLPVSVFASRVKTTNHDSGKIRENARRINSARFVRLGHKFPSIFRRAFSKYALDDIALIRSKILEADKETREFFVLALINTAMKASYAYKDGSVIKFRKHPAPPLRKLYARVVSRMIKEADKFSKNSADIVVDQVDARRTPLEDGSVDAVITSPPYLNNIDYTKVYAIEEFFIHGEEIPGVRTFIGFAEKTSDFLPEIDLPPSARLYFEDMNKVLEEVYRVLKADGKAAIVVGNGYVREVIESDVILAYLAEKIGFTLEKMVVLNKRFALEDRTTKVGLLRESVVILRKNERR